MHLLTACAVTLVFAIFLDWPRAKANGLLFVLKDYVDQISRRVTLRRVLYSIGILLFVLAAWQAVGFDWAFLALGGDAMLYLEIVSTVYLVAVRGHIYQIPRIVRAIKEVGQKSLRWRRLRREHRRRLRHDASSKGDNDDPADTAMVFVFAFS